MPFNIYTPTNQTLSERSIKRALSDYQVQDVTDPEGYIASEALADAVNVALALEQPLLLTGEPGTGKTRLARNIAYQLDVELYEFHTKSQSVARDLFYSYESLRHFHDAQLKDKAKLEVNDYVELEALGKAIAHSGEKGAVVLIDEIDKAPRDFPNDILNEIEKMRFRVKETKQSYEVKNRENRPIVVITSNSEKNLPDAFLRRCVFYHIPFPEEDILMKIVNSRLDLSDSFKEKMLEEAISHFVHIRKNKGMRKKPATAELLAWIHILDKLGVDMQDKEKLRKSYSILAKNADDYKRLIND